MKIYLDLNSSFVVLRRFFDSQLPVDLRFTAEGCRRLEVWEDASPTEYTLCFNADGTWCVRMTTTENP